MNAEGRTIKASILAGASEIITGLLLYFLGWGDWYYSHFHFFGMLGYGMMCYGYWHLYFLRKETGDKLWKRKL